MLQTWIHRIKPGMEPRLRDWLAELNARPGEVRESFSAAGVRAEQAFVLQDGAGWLLIYISEAGSHADAGRIFDQSGLPIDIEHRRVLEECIEETLTEPPVYDVSL